VSGYESRWDIPPSVRYNFAVDREYGARGEALVDEFLKSLLGEPFEIKSDRYRNGRMVVEMAHNPRRAGWKPSGLAVTEARWWVYVYSLDGAFAVISVARLRRYVALLGESRMRTFADRSSNPSMGFLLEPDEVIRLMYDEQYDDPS
jgi:hypothetical protein